MPITEMTIVAGPLGDPRTIPTQTVADALNVSSEYIGEWAKGKGFRETEDFIAYLERMKQRVNQDDIDVLDILIPHLRMLEAGNKHMLIVTEIAEAHENLRTYGHEQDDNYGEELADVIVRILDRAQAAGVKNIGRMFIEKLKINARRPHKHGRKF